MDGSRKTKWDQASENGTEKGLSGVLLVKTASEVDLGPDAHLTRSMPRALATLSTTLLSSPSSSARLELRRERGSDADVVSSVLAGVDVSRGAEVVEDALELTIDLRRRGADAADDVDTQDCSSEEGVKLARSSGGVDVAWKESKTPVTPKGARAGVTATLLRRCLLWLKKVSYVSERSARVARLDSDMLTLVWAEGMWVSENLRPAAKARAAALATCVGRKTGQRAMASNCVTESC